MAEIEEQRNQFTKTSKHIPEWENKVKYFN